MNPNQKIAQLRDQVEDFNRYQNHTEARLREAEKQISVIFVILLLVTSMLTAVAYTSLH